jgi:hypothetical protein
MTLSNAERQKRFRERRIKSGERVRVEFRVTSGQAEAFSALAARWQLSRTETFLRLCNGANPGHIDPSVAGLAKVQAELAELKEARAMERMAQTPRSRPAMLARVREMFTDITNWIARDAATFDDEQQRDAVYRFSSDASKLGRRIEKRYPDNNK